LTPPALPYGPKTESPLTAYGLNFSFATKPLWNMSLTSTQNFGQSKRIENGRYVSYEWEMPWSNKTGIRLGDSATAFQCFIMGTVCAGLPYHELGLSNGVLAFSEQQKRVPVYRNIDLKIQSAQQTIGHRYLTRLNGFVEVHNLLNILDGTTSSNPNWFWKIPGNIIGPTNLKRNRSRWSISGSALESGSGCNYRTKKNIIPPLSLQM